MRISVVIPTLNEATNILLRAAELRREAADVEWIVADGGSTDGTTDAARAAGAVVVRCAAGRGRQLDAGAACARGDILLFLHADTALPAGAFAAIDAALRDSAVAGGNFTLRFDERGGVTRLLEIVYALRRMLLHSYFGDSAIFVRREVYARIGGFGTAPIMEDFAFSRALQRSGRTVLLPLAVVTSARRYRDRPLAAIATWVWLITLYRLGVAPERLVRWYRPHAAAESRKETIAMPGAPTTADPFDLARFIAAQAPVYDTVVQELRSGRKRTHWMWFIFPQLRGLGRSHTAEFYGIASLAEARAYLAHDVLGARLVESTHAVLALPKTALREIFGSPDDMKFHSSMTLFAAARPEADSVFRRALERFCDGRDDPATIARLQPDSARDSAPS